MKDRLQKFWRDWRGFAVFVVIMLLFRSAIADWNQVPSGSMKPSILAGDRIVVDKLAYDLRVPFTDVRISRWENPLRGDVVTFENPRDGRLFVKRVVAIPGDVIELRDNRLIVNGERAKYTPLSKAEIDAYPLPERHDYLLLHEEIHGHRRVVMWSKRGALAQRHPYASFTSRTLPENGYWMMGDNRDNSSDSRVIGPIDRESIYGSAHAIAFSLDYDRYYMPRFSRFFTDLP